MTFSTYSTPAHLNAAQDYLDASNFLLTSPKSKRQRPTFSAPANFLLAHGAELTFKAYLSWSGTKDSDVVAVGHNISRAFQKIKANSPSFAKEVEQLVASKWRKYLQEARKTQVDALVAKGLNPETDFASLGIPSNSDIGEGLPTFARDLQWLSDRHKKNGGRFRYLEFGLDTKKVIQVFGLNEPTVPNSIYWGCEFILKFLNIKLRQS